MSPGPEDQWRPPEPPGRSPRPGGAPAPSGRPRWMPLVIVGLAILAPPRLAGDHRLEHAPGEHRLLASS